MEVAMADQDQWHFCGKCFGMFYFGDQQAHRGLCPAGGGHQAFGFNFVLSHDVPEGPGTQQEWRFCQNCFVMFYNGDQGGNKGLCPAGGGHQMFGFNFVLSHDVPEGPGTQQEWRFCQNCFVMFYNGDQGGNKGLCPAGGGHQMFGDNFVLPHLPEFLQWPSLSLQTVSIEGEGQFVEVSGAEFTSGSTARINYDLEFSDGGPTTHTISEDDVTVAGDRSFIDRIPVSDSNLTHVDVKGSDTVTGTEVTASLPAGG
ncbi:hypothetical protein ACIRRA_44410 [Nocardia sp. NPDC101769]|uniref:hypothetical protein n=1 Tax=Nocardia sp. NPDC101769 TaxID=3364333 RepID=UPI0037FB04B8